MRIKCEKNCKGSRDMPMFMLQAVTVMLREDLSPFAVSYASTDPREVTCQHCGSSVKITGDTAHGTRILSDPISIRHADLDACTPEIDVFRSDCPICDGGLLLGERAKDTYELLAEDRCTLCGQRFTYTDMEEFMKGGKRNV
jgi:hypothetical protein